MLDNCVIDREDTRFNGHLINSSSPCKYAFCYSAASDSCPADNKCGDPGCFMRFFHYNINITAMNVFGRSDAWKVVYTDEEIGKTVSYSRFCFTFCIHYKHVACKCLLLQLCIRL
jgi:hypothetical protein